jgi:uncharacterized protein (DUF58 family)
VTPVLKVIYRGYCFSLRLRRWVLRRFTRPGLAMLGALLAVGLAAPDPDLSAAYQAFALLLGLVLVAACFTRAFPARFSATRLLPAFGTAGAPFRYRVVIRNLTPQTQSGLTLLEDLAEPQPSFQDWRAFQLAEAKLVRSFRLSQRRRPNPFKLATVKDAFAPPAPPNQETEVKIELTPVRRGVLRFRGVTLARPDPLGLLRSFITLPLPQTALILPKRYPLPPIALPGTLKYQAGGVALAASVGQSDEFVALRDYRNGDPFRHIHWRSWAKAGKPVVKEFEDEFFVRHALVLDTFNPHPHSEVFEEAVSVAASFVCTIQTQESLLDLLFVGPQSYRFTAGRGLAHAEQMLEILASVCACSDQPFRALEHLVLTHVNSLSGCICVLVAWDDERRGLIRKLRLLGVPVLVLVIVESGTKPALDPGPLRDQPQCFHVLETGRIEEGLGRLK